jgi:hypothetical protein
LNYVTQDHRNRVAARHHHQFFVQQHQHVQHRYIHHYQHHQHYFFHQHFRHLHFHQYVDVDIDVGHRHNILDLNLDLDLDLGLGFHHRVVHLVHVDDREYLDYHNRQVNINDQWRLHVSHADALSHRDHIALDIRQHLERTSHNRYHQRHANYWRRSCRYWRRRCTGRVGRGAHCQAVSVRAICREAVPAAARSSHAAARHRFLKNTAAVAGTFSAVGVIALIVLFWAGTAFMRRRRERRYDDEADAAAAEAYKSAAGQAPYLDDDDDDDFPGAVRSAYSRDTAASMGQPPLVPTAGESYGMRELAPNAGYAPDAGVYGAAGLGAGLGANAAVQRQRSQKSAGSSVSPYNAYAGPGSGADWQYGGQQDPYAAAYPIPNAQPYQPYGGPQPGYADAASHQDLLASAGVPPHAEDEAASHRLSSAAVAAQQRGVALARSPSQAVTVHAGADALYRNKSITLEQGWAVMNAQSAPVQYASAQSAQVQYAPAQNPYADVYEGTHGRRSSLLDPAQYSESGGHQEQHRAYFGPGADGVIPSVNYLDDDGASVRSADHPRVLRVSHLLSSGCPLIDWLVAGGQRVERALLNGSRRSLLRFWTISLRAFVDCAILDGLAPAPHTRRARPSSAACYICGAPPTAVYIRNEELRLCARDYDDWYCT